MFNFEEELKKLPHTPGVYLMHNKTDEIIYVGKAIDLYNRVHQYFQAGYKRSPKIEKMVSHIAWFEYIICESEIEALVLECNLIKEHRPHYNTMLTDDKLPIHQDHSQRGFSSYSVLASDAPGSCQIFWSLY